jgi:hypothetical protein
MTALFGGLKQLVGCRKHEKIEKVTASQDDGFVVSWRCKKSIFSDFDCVPDKLALMGLRPVFFGPCTLGRTLIE